MSSYAWTIPTALSPAEAIDRATAALAEQGFGILSRIDVHEVFQKKLGITRAPYTILGACNPNFARQALEAVNDLGILLPCNVVVEADGAGTKVHVTNPEALFTLVDNPAVQPLVLEITGRLRQVVRALGGEA